MKSANSLQPEIRTLLLDRLTIVLFWDERGIRWDRDKGWNSDTLDQIGLLMQEYGLVPDHGHRDWCDQCVDSDCGRCLGV